MAPEDETGSGFDDEGSKMRRIAGLVSGLVLGSIAIMMCLALCLWRIQRKQPGGVKASTAACVDEVIRIESRAEFSAEGSDCPRRGVCWMLVIWMNSRLDIRK
jgi:hypothetical protein